MNVINNTGMKRIKNQITIAVIAGKSIQIRKEVPSLDIEKDRQKQERREKEDVEGNRAA